MTEEEKNAYINSFKSNTRLVLAGLWEDKLSGKLKEGNLMDTYLERITWMLGWLIDWVYAQWESDWYRKGCDDVFNRRVLPSRDDRL